MEAQSRVPLRVYKTGELITTPEQLPVPFQLRTSTDRFCTIITSLFAIAMLGIAIASFNLTQLAKMTYPTDSAGRHCTLDNPNYNYLYFPSPNNPSNRICLNSCPTSAASTLNCWPTANISCAANSNPQFQVVIYPTYASSTSLGLYCLPSDPTLRSKILTGAGLQTMFNFVAAYESMGVSLLCGLGLGLLCILLFSCMPQAMAYISVIVGGSCCVVLAILLFVNLIQNNTLPPLYTTFVYFFVAALILVGIILVIGLCCHRQQIQLSISYMREAATCLWESPGIILMSFVFVGLLAGLIALCIFQVLGYWAGSNMVFYPNQVYYRPQSTFATVMTTLCAIQFIWGLCFLKQAFNFMVSGMAVNWHFEQKLSLGTPLAKMFRFHWGSVAAGAFLLNIFYPIDLIYDLLKPNPHTNDSSCCFSCLCCCCERVLDLARTQSMTLINILGAPYCNSSRLCEQIVYYSSYTVGGESANRFVRIGQHVLFSSLAALGGWLYMTNNGQSSMLAISTAFILNLFMLTFFVCLLNDMAEALLFCDLIDNCIDGISQINQKNENIAKQLFPEGYEVIRTSS